MLAVEQEGTRSVGRPLNDLCRCLPLEGQPRRFYTTWIDGEIPLGILPRSRQWRNRGGSQIAFLFVRQAAVRQRPRQRVKRHVRYPVYLVPLVHQPKAT